MRNRVLTSWTLLWSVGCGGGADLSAPPPPPAVTVAEVRGEKLAEWDEYQGEFEAIDAVEIRPRVSGYLVRVAFVEGKEVRKGDVLFEIDPEPYQATLDERRADLARTRARLALVERDAERGERLVKAQAISQEEMDTRLTLVSETRAGVLAGEAAVRAAELDLAWTKVRAPVDGRTGRAEVTEGNLVTAGPTGATLLTTIVSIDPIYVYFEGDESAYLRYAHLDQTGERVSSRRAANPVQIGLSDEDGFPHRGRMDFVDNQLDRETGTIRARAIVDNRDRVFTPGMFARVRLLGSGVRPVTLIPEVAIATDQDRKFVYVLNPDSTVVYRSVTLGRQVDGQRRIIREGLKPGELVVVNGLARIRPGAKVKATLQAPDSTDAAAATPADSGSEP
jgi:RND family efflux transporter MFP subunit